MFVQIIEGRARDTEGIRRLTQRWMDELRPGATGYLGTTGGVAASGHAIALIRFESAEAAMANSTRPEQGAWWAEMQACYDGEIAFFESDDTKMFLGGGSNDAGFVQIMKSHGVDRDLVSKVDAVYEQHAPTSRPDLIGGYRVWIGPDSGYDVNYFTSEDAARAGESTEPPAELRALAGDLAQMMANTEFIDLTDPWIY